MTERYCERDCFCLLSPSPFSDPSRLITYAKKRRDAMGVPSLYGGAGGIRTYGTAAGTPDFESCSSLVVPMSFLAVSGCLIQRKSLKKQGLLLTMGPNPLLYRYFFKNADFGAFFARLQEIGKKMARKISVVYTGFFACQVSCRQENGRKKPRRFWIRSHGEEPKNAEKTSVF